MSTDGQLSKWRRNIAENFNRLSRAHERYRQRDRRQTDGLRHKSLANEKVLNSFEENRLVHPRKNPATPMQSSPWAHI